MRVARLLLPLVAVLALAGCGGGSSGSATGTASGAEVAPADALAYVSIDTDRDSDQWQQADKLLEKFPIHNRLLTQLCKKLSEEGVDFQNEVLPVLGRELDLVVMSAAQGREPQLIALAQPTDEDKFNALLEKGKEPSVHTKVGDWTAFADKQAALDAFTNAQNGAKLADDQQFNDAMGELPDEANAKAYLSGDKLLTQLGQAIPNLGAIPGGQDIRWLAVALESTSEGWKIEGAAKSAQSFQTFTPRLLSKVPSNAFAVLSFRGNDQAFMQLRDNPQLSQALAQMQAMLGVSLQDLEQLLSGEGALYASAGIPYPEVTLLVRPKNAQQAQATLDRLAAKATSLEPGLGVTRVSFHGVTVRKLTLSSVAIYWGIRGGVLIVSDTTAPFVGTRPSIRDDKAFSAAKDAAGLPDSTAGFLYVNLKQAAPFVLDLAQMSNTEVPPEVSANLAPLRSFLAYGSGENGVSRFAALLQVQ